jgi:hypothetical protein
MIVYLTQRYKINNSVSSLKRVMFWLARSKLFGFLTENITCILVHTFTRKFYSHTIKENRHMG